MKILTTRLILFLILLFSTSCIWSLFDDNYLTIESTKNTRKNSITGKKNPDLILSDDGKVLKTKPIYNFGKMFTGFLKPIHKNGNLIFSDKFIDDGVEDIFYLNEPIVIKDCNDLMRYDLREVKNIATNDKNVLIQRKRVCILIDELTNGTNFLAKGNDYGSTVLKPTQHELDKVLASIPHPFNNSKQKFDFICSDLATYNIMECKDISDEDYRLYLIRVARIKDNNYYYLDLQLQRMPLYYLVKTNNTDIEIKSIYK